MKRLSMLDLTQNRLRVLHPLGSEVALVQLFLDNNQLEEIPTDENGIFCNIADMTDLSASYNKLRKFPNIFKDAKSAIANIDLSYNQIANFTEEETAAFHGWPTANRRWPTSSSGAAVSRKSPKAASRASIRTSSSRWT